MRIFAIKTCDTCRKARKWLDQQGKAHDRHDLREDGVDRALIQRWLDAVGPEALVNRRSTPVAGQSRPNPVRIYSAIGNRIAKSHYFSSIGLFQHERRRTAPEESAA
jgi:glutaredoxin